MKIVIALVILLLIVAIVWLLRRGPAQRGAAGEPAASTAPSPASAPAAAPVADQAAAEEAAPANEPAAALSAAVALDKLPPEHLPGVDRALGRALREQGIDSIAALQSVSDGALSAAGADPVALRRQAALSALPGLTPDQLAALSDAGVDSIAALAAADPAALVARSASANRLGGALKSGLGVQQLARLVARARALA